MSTDTAIQIDGIGKRYRLGNQSGGYYRYKSLRDTLGTTVRRPWSLLANRGEMNEDNSFWSLKDVSFEVKQGEVVGIIGRNGAGKSTLLKILSQITKPTKGDIAIRGRVGSLLEVGTGFHPELSGRENIYLNGAILGMTRGEVKSKFDEIVAFSEIDRFLDTPVKQYSSGMYTRLAFAVAAHLEPEILVVDEVLAVGDAAFQKKCLGKMKDVAGEGRTVLFVSHNMAAVQRLCGRIALLERGNLLSIGSADVMLAEYRSASFYQHDVPLEERLDRSGTGSARLTRFEVLPESRSSSERLGAVGVGEAATLRVGFVTSNVLRDPVLHVTVYDDSGDALLNLSTEATGFRIGRTASTRTLVCRIPKIPLRPGMYDVNLAIEDAPGEFADRVERAGVLVVEQGDYFGVGSVSPWSRATFCVDHTWENDLKES